MQTKAKTWWRNKAVKKKQQTNVDKDEQQWKRANKGGQTADKWKNSDKNV